jgi:HK97 family phage prohead protease
LRAASGCSVGAPEVKLIADDITHVDADGSFSGYASLFGVADLSRDIVEKGAFLASLGRRGAGGVKMLYQHDPTEPIGRWTDIRETAKGLKVTGQLTTTIARGRDVLQLMRDGVLDGLSIGFRTVNSRTDRKSGIRRLMEIDLWEISVVTFPMQPEARVSQVKAFDAARADVPLLNRELALAHRIARLEARVSSAT